MFIETSLPKISIAITVCAIIVAVVFAKRRGFGDPKCYVVWPSWIEQRANDRGIRMEQVVFISKLGAAHGAGLSGPEWKESWRGPYIKAKFIRDPQGRINRKTGLPVVWMVTVANEDGAGHEAASGIAWMKELQRDVESME